MTKPTNPSKQSKTPTKAVVIAEQRGDTGAGLGDIINMPLTGTTHMPEKHVHANVDAEEDTLGGVDHTRVTAVSEAKAHVQEIAASAEESKESEQRKHIASRGVSKREHPDVSEREDASDGGGSGEVVGDFLEDRIWRAAKVGAASFVFYAVARFAHRRFFAKVARREWV
jgi:hypothetical protein